MRGFRILVTLGLVGGCTADAGTCSEAACKGLCDEAGAAQAAAVGGEVVYLDAYESERLAEVVPQVARGLLPAEDPAMRLCAGAGPCADAPPLDLSQPLPAGLYSMAVDVVVPARGSWKLEARGRCFSGDLPTVEVDLTESLGKVVSLDPIATFEFPVNGTKCHVSVSSGEFRRELLLELVPVPPDNQPAHPPYDQPK